MGKESALDDPAFYDQTQRFVTASLEGWLYCRDFEADCLEHVLSAGPVLGRSHQEWQLAKVNELVWPSTAGLGLVKPTKWVETAITLGENEARRAPETHELGSVLVLEYPATVMQAHTEAFVEAAHVELAVDYPDLYGTGYQYHTPVLLPGGH